MDERIACFSPMRNKEYLANEVVVGDSYANTVMSCSRGIMTRDRFDCTRSDMLLVNLLNAKKVSIGTVMEMAWADLKRIPIVIAMEADNVHAHAMIQEAAGFVVGSLEEAMRVVERVLLPDFGPTSFSRPPNSTHIPTDHDLVPRHRAHAENPGEKL
jgi:hypothetical protein